jgi:hypothetical protein
MAMLPNSKALEETGVEFINCKRRGVRMMHRLCVEGHR